MANMMDHAKVISVKNALRHGDIFTRLSAVIMRAGNICRKQLVKGLLYLAAEILFIAFMVVSGVGLLGGLTTLGTNEGGEVFNEAAQVYEYTSGDNSMLILLYGILAIIAVIAFVLLWRSSLKSAYQAQLLQQEGKAVPNFRQDLAALLDQNLHKTLLAGPIVCIIAFTIQQLWKTFRQLQRTWNSILACAWLDDRLGGFCNIFELHTGNDPRHCDQSSRHKVEEYVEIYLCIVHCNSSVCITSGH